MNYTVHISKSAQKDIEEIISYFIESRPDYAKKLFLSIFGKINTLKTFPPKGRVVKNFTKTKHILQP